MREMCLLTAQSLQKQLTSVSSTYAALTSSDLRSAIVSMNAIRPGSAIGTYLQPNFSLRS